MSLEEFVNYYEVLEVSPNANSYTIERVFRFLAKRFHPDVADSGDMQRFSQIVDAYDTLRDPEKRTAYDIEFEAQREEVTSLVEESGKADGDCLDRHRLLTLFYGQRRRSMKQPGVGMGTLEQAIDLPIEILEFHLWYFREKGWIKREDSGLLAITAEGVDHIENRIHEAASQNVRKIESGPSRIENKSSSRQVHSTPASV